jgi:hypothetical protein
MFVLYVFVIGETYNSNLLHYFNTMEQLHEQDP